MELTTTDIESFAPNANTIKNGNNLAKTNKLSNLKIDKQKEIIWGECQGSGKTAYQCSADFEQNNLPVFRCTCPVRQFPCKHCVGLMYAYVEGTNFETDEIPNDIVEKREKLKKRQNKKETEKKSLKEKAESIKPVKKETIIKKTEKQLEGIKLAEKIINNIIQNGLSTIDSAEQSNIRKQIKEIGNYHIAGIQTTLNNVLLELPKVENNEYSNIIIQLNYTTALLKRAKEHLNSRLQNPDQPLVIDSQIEEQIGHIWKLTELIQYGLYEENAELLQLSYNSYENLARKEYVDEGYWINLKTGKLYKTNTFRPYKASKYITQEDSQNDVLQIKDLYIYPGDTNPRVRWESQDEIAREIKTSDIELIRKFSSDNYSESIKQVKNIIKNPLADKHPILLINIKKAYLNGFSIVIEDEQQNKLTLSFLKNQKTEKILENILAIPTTEKLSLLIMINSDLKTGMLTVVPLSVITENQIIKLLF